MQSVLHAAAMIPASIPSPDWSGFDIPLPWGSLRIHAYALCILAGIIAGLWLTSVRWAKRGAPEGSVWDIAIWAIPFGIIGGRLYHVFSSPDAVLRPRLRRHRRPVPDPADPARRPGHLGRRACSAPWAPGSAAGVPGVKLSAFLDAAAPGLLLAQAIGRWGNYFNQELFGGPTTLPWGLQIDADNPNFPAGMPAGHAVPPDVPLRVAVEPRRRAASCWPWTASSASAAAASSASTPCTTRWAASGSRPCGSTTPNRSASSGITTRLNVWTSIFVFAGALLAFILLGLRKRSEPDTPFLPGRAPAETEPAGNAGGDYAG